MSANFYRVGCFVIAISGLACMVIGLAFPDARHWIVIAMAVVILVWLIQYLGCLYYQHKDADDLEGQDYGC